MAGACRLTLDAMRRGGLHDHLQGGIFRYCVDRQWTIPHFEKMLYDQAMALWCYALAFRVLGNTAYRDMACGIVRCLDETFATDGLFATAFDADTQHHEGLTYVWQYDEIKAALTAEEFQHFAASYRLPEKGNFECAIQLTRSDDRPLRVAEEKLLAIRRIRPQPARDEKSALRRQRPGRLFPGSGGAPAGPARTGSGRAARLVKKLLDVFWDGKRLAHSLANGTLQRQEFLSDAAALLLAVTMLHESDPQWTDAMNTLERCTAAFSQEGRWIESSHADFRPVASSWFDHPVPAGASLAVMALARAAVLRGAAPAPLEYLRPQQSDFYNIAAMIGQGLFHQVHSMEGIAWQRLPANSIQVRGEPEADCYKNQCRPLAF